jgi:uncharacterized protein YbjT (DUF2867 family)
MILVTGATGKVGRELVNFLLERGEEVTAVTRTPDSAALPGGVRVVGGDPAQPHTLTPALRGVDAVFLNPRAVAAAAGDLLALAAENGVRRVVVLSALTLQFNLGSRRFADEFQAVEDAVTGSGLHWTFLRCADFDANAMVWAPQIHSGNVVRGAYGEAATSPIHERDIAAVAAQALVNGAYASQAYVLTGPQSLTQRERVRIIGQTIGRSLEWEEMSADQMRRAMLAQGLPEDVPDRLLGYMADCLEKPGPSSSAVKDILARPALSFADWAAEHAAVFRN